MRFLGSSPPGNSSTSAAPVMCVCVWEGKKITDGEADEKRGAFHWRNLDLSVVLCNCNVLYLLCQVKAMNLSVWAGAIHVAPPELHFFFKV